MKVKELIELLQKLNQEKKIVVEDNVTYDTSIGEMGEWRLFTPQVIESDSVYLIISKDEEETI